jgi:hypothetical protein
MADKKRPIAEVIGKSFVLFYDVILMYDRG